MEIDNIVFCLASQDKVQSVVRIRLNW